MSESNKQKPTARKTKDQILDEVVEKAYDLGRNDNIFSDNYEIINNKIKGTNIELSLEVDENILNT